MVVGHGGYTAFQIVNRLLDLLQTGFLFQIMAEGKRVEFRQVLGQVPDCRFPGHFHRSRVRMCLSPDEAQQGGFPAAVVPHQPHACPFRDEPVHSVE